MMALQGIEGEGCLGWWKQEDQSRGWINNPEGRRHGREVPGDDGGGGQKLLDS